MTATNSILHLSSANGAIAGRGIELVLYGLIRRTATRGRVARHGAETASRQKPAVWRRLLRSHL